MKMKIKRTEQIGFRTTKEVFQRLEQLAKDGYRSLSQQVEKIILEHPDFKDIRDKVLGKDK